MELKDRKPEKLSSAIYLITGFLSDQEPLKWKLRTFASELVSSAVSLKERQIVAVEIREIVLKIMGLLAVAKNVGLVSAENHGLIQEELTKYADTLDYSANISDFLSMDFPKQRIEQLGEGHTIKDKSLKKFGAVSVKKNSRQGIIITLLKRKREVMIKDVSSLISDCSEKTIQRELSLMVRAGILRKMGEKRWSRYTLASYP
ncbi:MAG: hypothetical protein Q7R69_02215 [bacterium]|nr:hypothetical protein [bacterium]